MRPPKPFDLTLNEVLAGLSNGSIVMGNPPLKPKTRVVKINSEPGDAHADGALGTIKGALGPLPEDVEIPGHGIIKAGTYGYFVNWDGLSTPVLCLSNKLRAVQ